MHATNNKEQIAEAFESIKLKASELQQNDFDGAKECLEACRGAGLSKARTALVMSIIMESTAFDASVVRTLADEVQREHPLYGDLSDLPKTTAALQAELQARHGQVIRTEGSFWVYKGRHDDEEYGIWTPLTDDEIDRVQIESFPPEVTARATFRREVLRRLSMSVERQDAFGDAAPGIALLNGFARYNFDSKSIELVDHAAEHLARNKVDASYDPGAEAPIFNRKLRRIFAGNIKKSQAFLEFLGCAVFGIMPDQDKVRTCLILHGGQRTGKSTLIDLSHIFFKNDQIASLSPDLLGAPERNAMLAGKALNTVTELHPRKKIRSDTLKQVLSREPVTARRLYGNLFTYTPRLCQIWACNDLARLDETHPSLMRRFIGITMGETLNDAEAAEGFWEAIEEEANGIVALVAKSFCDVMARGHFILPDESDLLVSRMQFGDDLVRLFARFHLEARPGARETSAELQSRMRAFASELGMDPAEAVHSGTMKHLSVLMRATWGTERRKLTGAPFYQGVALTSSASGATTPQEGPKDVGLADL